LVARDEQHHLIRIIMYADHDAIEPKRGGIHCGRQQQRVQKRSAELESTLIDMVSRASAEREAANQYETVETPTPEPKPTPKFMALFSAPFKAFQHDFALMRASGRRFWGRR